MKHAIDPKVDCVFKAILGAEDNRNLLIHFLNAVLIDELGAPIVSVELLNPYNERETLDDKLSIVDVKARDQNGRLFQVEIQLLSYTHLPARILYTWCDIHAQQLSKGQDYSRLKPTYSIWLLDHALIPDQDYAHDYKVRDRQGQALIEQGGIWIFELTKFATCATITSEVERWLMFFKTGQTLDEERLPEWMRTNEMRQAMETVRQFSEKDRAYDAYQARLNYQRQQRAIQYDLEQARQAEAQARQGEERARQGEERARQGEERARQGEERARQAEEAARGNAEIERNAKEVALAEKEAALAEVARLKAELQRQANND